MVRRSPRVVASEREEKMQGVCDELERCRTPDDQEVVEGLIKKFRGSHQNRSP